MEHAGSEAIPPPQTQTEPDPAGLTATKLRKRKADKPEKTSSEKPKPEEIEEKNPLDESSQREKWREKAQELINTYLQPATKPELTPEELGKASLAIQTKLANQPVTPEDQRILYLTVGWMIDGSTHPLADLATLVRTHLAELGTDTSGLAEGWPDLLITHLALKEDLNHIPKPPEAASPAQGPTLPTHFWQPLAFPDTLPVCYSSRSSLRSKLVSSLETLSKLLVQLHKCPNTTAGLQKLVEQEKKHLAAEHKVEKEKEKQRGEEEKRRKDEEKKEEKRRAEEEKEEKRRAEEGRKEEKRKAEEERKRVDEEKKEEKRKAEEEKKRLEEEKKEERRKAEEEKKEEKRKLDEERKRLEELRKEEKRKQEEERKKREEEEKRKKHGAALTTFGFIATPKEANSLANSGVGLPGEPTEGPGSTVPSTVSIWRHVVGTAPRYSQWSDERCESFLSGLKNCLSSNQFRPSIQLLKSDLIEQLADLRKSKPSKFLEGDTMCEEGPKPRRVFIKYEDYLKASYEYTGMFKRRSLKIRPTDPFAKDEELIDYELSSEDELELQEEAESLNSKEEDAGEEEELEDGDDFVVPDGYLSASEVESLDGQDKQKLLQRKANNPKNLAKKVLHLYDFTAYTRGEDFPLDDLADRLRIVSIFPNSFPLAIEIEPEVVPGAPEITDEQLVEIVKAIHCCSNKLEEIEKLRKKFGNIPKTMIKNKVDDITTAGILVDPELYEKNGSNTDEYLKDIIVLFLKREEEEEIEGAAPAADAETQKKERLTRGGEKLDGERLWQLAKSLNGTREGLTKKENKILTEFQRKHTTLTRREIDRRAKENALNLYLVDPMVFESLVTPSLTQNIKDEFLGSIRATFKARAPPVPEAPELPEQPKEVVEKAADKSSAEKTSDKKKLDQLKPASPMGKEPTLQPEKVLQFSEAKVARPTHKEGKKPEEDELRELQPKEVVAPVPEPVKGPKQVGLLSFFNGKQDTAHLEPLPAEKENKRKRK